MPQDPQLFGETAVTHGFLTAEKLAQTLEYQRAFEPGRALGELLVERGLLSSSQAAAIEKLRVVLESSHGVATADDNELVGKTLQRCLILEPIGSGGMGTTYRAHHLRLDRDVAIKVLHPRLVKVPGNLQRFEREARSAAKLEHPGIVQVYDFDEERGFHFIVMQFAEGQNLREVLYRKGPLGTRRTVWVGQRVLEALDHAHSLAIVHRDVKPANLIITKEPRVKVTDFGLVRVLSATTSERLSAYGEILGTPQYMSPEQACSARWTRAPTSTLSGSRSSSSSRDARRSPGRRRSRCSRSRSATRSPSSRPSTGASPPRSRRSSRSCARRTRPSGTRPPRPRSRPCARSASTSAPRARSRPAPSSARRAGTIPRAPFPRRRW